MTYTVTTPIFYANGTLHIGHAYTCIAADVTARFRRLRGEKVLFTTGIDEYGQKVAEKAKSLGLSPQDHVDKISENFQQTASLLNLSEHLFIRTTSPAHHKAAQALWTRILSKGLLTKGRYTGWYSTRDERFVPKGQISSFSDTTAISHDGETLHKIEEETYFFPLSRFQKQLHERYTTHPETLEPSSIRHVILNQLEQPLNDLSVSRTSLSWGIPVPHDDQHVFYVWFDALVNYLTAKGFPDTCPTTWNLDLHLIGKDIARFHAIYWPAFLLAADLPLPKKIFAHGWWLHDGQKISKSQGNALPLNTIIAERGLDALRYTILRETPFGQDGNLTFDSLHQRYTHDLANDLGNLAQRVLTLLYKNQNDHFHPRPLPDDTALLDTIRSLPDKVNTAIDSVALTDGLTHIWDVVRITNAYIAHQQPWSVLKTNHDRSLTILDNAHHALITIGICLIPYIPYSAHRLLDQCGIEPENRTLLTQQSHRRVPEKPTALFPK